MYAWQIVTIIATCRIAALVSIPVSSYMHMGLIILHE